jgi:hypothetical protein
LPDRNAEILNGLAAIGRFRLRLVFWTGAHFRLQPVGALLRSGGWFRTLPSASPFKNIGFVNERAPSFMSPDAFAR